jgi:AcrR family transcriptional regulator
MPKKLNKKNEINKILQTAMQCFTTSGYANTTMDDIAAKYGKSKASIYMHFKSKKAIFLALANYWLSQFKKALLPIFRSKEQPEIILSKTIQILADRIENDIPFFKAHLEFLHHSYLDKQAKNRMQKIHKFWTDELTAVFIPICPSAQIARQLAIFMMSVYDGYIIRALTANDISLKNEIYFIEKVSTNLLRLFRQNPNSFL